MNETQASREIGLCSRCVHARMQSSARGSDFWRCALADSEPQYARYPPLPVDACAGFEQGAPPSR